MLRLCQFNRSGKGLINLIFSYAINKFIVCQENSIQICQAEKLELEQINILLEFGGGSCKTRLYQVL